MDHHMFELFVFQRLFLWISIFIDQKARVQLGRWRAGRAVLRVDRSGSTPERLLRWLRWFFAPLIVFSFVLYMCSSRDLLFFRDLSKMKHSVTVRPKAMLSAVLAEDGLPEVKYKTCASYRGRVAATPSQSRSSAAAEHMRINGAPAVDANGPCKMLLLGAWSIFRPPWILNLTALKCRKLRPR
uniref:Uncharacterized protein n=1 Tax=Aegilops tauschii TaxID=37682 RepID=M8BF03_AEGTA